MELFFILLIVGVGFVLYQVSKKKSAPSKPIPCVSRAEIEEISEEIYNGDAFLDYDKERRPIFRKQIAALIKNDDGALEIGVFQEDFNRSSYILMNQINIEPDMRFEVRQKIFRKAQFDYVVNGNSGYFKRSPKDETGSALVAMKSTGHITEILEFPHINSDTLAANTLASLRQKIAALHGSSFQSAPIAAVGVKGHDL